MLCICYLSWLRYPRRVGIVDERIFLARDSVSPGQDWKFPFLIALMKVGREGESKRHDRIVLKPFLEFFMG